MKKQSKTPSKTPETQNTLHPTKAQLIKFLIEYDYGSIPSEGDTHWVKFPTKAQWDSAHLHMKSALIETLSHNACETYPWNYCNTCPCNHLCIKWKSPQSQSDYQRIWEYYNSLLGEAIIEDLL